MLETIFTIILSVAAIILVLATFLYFFVDGMLSDLGVLWGELYKKLRLRLNKIPSLIETVRAHSTEYSDVIGEIIKLRSHGLQDEFASAKKVQQELIITNKLKDLWAAPNKVQDLAKDVNFLSLKMEFKTIGGEIEDLVEKYNRKVRSYNNLVVSAWFLPFNLVFKFRKLPIFEFES